MHVCLVSTLKINGVCACLYAFSSLAIMITAALATIPLNSHVFDKYQSERKA